MSFISKNPKDTIQFAQNFAKKLKGHEVIALDGTLGMGKTVFARAVIQSLTHQEQEVPSPTFTLLQTYDSTVGPIYHFDFYRLKNPMEAYEVGVEDAFADGICLIEWPDKIGRILPKNAIHVLFEPDGDYRKITIQEAK